MHGNKFIFLFSQVMKQTGGLYPAPLKILEVSLVVIIILMQTLLSLSQISLLLYIHKTMGYYSTWFIGDWEGLMVELCRKKLMWQKFFSPVLLILRSRERFEAVIFCVNASVGNQSKSNLFHFERDPCNTGSEGSEGFIKPNINFVLIPQSQKATKGQCHSNWVELQYG